MALQSPTSPQNPDRERLLKLKDEFRRQFTYERGFIGVGLTEHLGRTCLHVSALEGIQVPSDFRGVPVVPRVGSLPHALTMPPLAG